MLFYEESVLITAEDAVVVIGTDIPQADIGKIDTLVIPDAESLQKAEMLMQVYEVGTVYIPKDDALYNLCSGFDCFAVRVEGSMSFGIGGASVSVSAGQSDPSLITRVSLGEDRLLICGSMDKQRLEELKNIDSGSFGYINFTSQQKDIAKEILSIYTPHTLVFTGCEPYIEDYEIANESIILKE